MTTRRYVHALFVGSLLGASIILSPLLLVSCGQDVTSYSITAPGDPNMQKKVPPSSVDVPAVVKRVAGRIFTAPWFEARHHREGGNLVYEFETPAAFEWLRLDAAIHWSPTPGLPATLENKVQLYPVSGDTVYPVGQSGLTRYAFDISGYCYGTLQPDLDMIMGDGSHRNLLAGESAPGGPVVPIDLGPKPPEGDIETHSRIFWLDTTRARIEVEFRPVALTVDKTVVLVWTGSTHGEPRRTENKKSWSVASSCQGVTYGEPYRDSWFTEGPGHLPPPYGDASYEVVVE